MYVEDQIWILSKVLSTLNPLYRNSVSEALLEGESEDAGPLEIQGWGGNEVAAHRKHHQRQGLQTDKPQLWGALTTLKTSPWGSIGMSARQRHREPRELGMSFLAQYFPHPSGLLLSPRESRGSLANEEGGQGEGEKDHLNSPFQSRVLARMEMGWVGLEIKRCALNCPWLFIAWKRYLYGMKIHESASISPKGREESFSGTGLKNRNGKKEVAFCLLPISPII